MTKEKLSNNEKLALVTKAVEANNERKLSNFMFAMVIGAIIQHPEVQFEDFGWGTDELAEIREEAKAGRTYDFKVDPRAFVIEIKQIGKDGDDVALSVVFLPDEKQGERA